MKLGNIHRRGLRLAGNFLLAALVVLFSGCLSLGGKTTYVQESAETTQRLDSLEARVGSLEQAVLPSKR